MALFPAYSSENCEILENRNQQTEPEEVIVLSNREEESNIYLDELKLLQSTSNSDQSESSLEKQPSIHRQKKRKRSSNGSDKESVDSKKSKRRKKSSIPKPIFDTEDEFYIDKKLDHGNIRVSTLYIPGRPQYHYDKNTIGVLEFPTKKNKTKVKRYFQVALKMIDVKEQLISSPQEGSNEAKSMASFINISDSSSKLKLISDCMLAKAATFMDGVRNNPNDIDLWMEYVHFQKEFFALEKCHGRVKEENAQNLCHDKQLDILNKALILNPYDMSLLSAKVTISEQRFSNTEYSDILKGLIKNADKNIPDVVLCHLWCWFVEAVQCSMALCYVSRITDMYQHTVSTLSKRQGSNYQSSHVELMYRFGLFLRQCGMWEHLWTLIKLNAEMNLDSSGGVCPIKCFQFDEDKAKELEMADKEVELISCGLPLSTVWVRVERLRSVARWRAVAATDAHDPQRCVRPAQLQPMLRPVTRRAPVFTLAVHMLRLLKVPLLPLRTGLLNALHPSGIYVRWQYDAIEDLLPLLYAGMSSTQDISQAYLASICRVVAEFVEQPHYFNDSQGYLTFVNDFFLTIADWFSQRDKTAILVWWIRFQTLTCSLNIGDKEEGNRVRKQVQKVLKLNRGDVILYGEFACLESVVSGRERGLDVALAVLRNTKPDQGLDHTYLSRCYVELILKGNVENKSECQTMAVNVLISLALGKSLPGILTSQYLEVDVLKALEKMQEHLDTLLLRLDSGGGMAVCEHWLPGLPAEWAVCCVWLRYLAAPRAHLHRLLHKLLAATHAPKPHTPATDRRLWLRENIYECFTKVLTCNVRVTGDSGLSEDATLATLLRDGLGQFPHNAQLGWQAAGGARLTRGLPSTAAANGTANGTLVSLALLLQEFVRLYSTKDECDGQTDTSPTGLSTSCSNRLRAMLVRLCRRPSLRRAALLWKMRLLLEHNTTTLYLALDDCPWNKELYVWGCQQCPGEWRTLLDLVLEKELRLHAMPEELEPL